MTRAVLEDEASRRRLVPRPRQPYRADTRHLQGLGLVVQQPCEDGDFFPNEVEAGGGLSLLQVVGVMLLLGRAGLDPTHARRRREER